MSFISYEHRKKRKSPIFFSSKCNVTTGISSKISLDVVSIKKVDGQNFDGEISSPSLIYTAYTRKVFKPRLLYIENKKFTRRRLVSIQGPTGYEPIALTAELRRRCVVPVP